MEKQKYCLVDFTSRFSSGQCCVLDVMHVVFYGVLIWAPTLTTHYLRVSNQPTNQPTILVVFLFGKWKAMDSQYYL